MSILNSGTALERITKFLRKVFKGKPATTAELNKTARNLGLNEKEVDRVIAAFKSEETTDLNKVDDLMDSTKVDDANLTKASDRVDTMSGDDLLREAQTAQLDITAPLTRSMSDPSDVKGIANLKGVAGRGNSDAVVGMPEGIERSIKFVGERTGLPDSIVKKALKVKMMEGYEAGNYKGLANEAEDMKAYIDTQIMGDDTLTFLEEIEQIGKELIDSRGVGSMTEAFDNAMDAKTVIDKAKGGRVGYTTGGFTQLASAPDPMAERGDMLENMAMERYGKPFDSLPEVIQIQLIEDVNEFNEANIPYAKGGRVGFNMGGYASFKEVIEQFAEGLSQEEFDLFIEMPRDKQIEIMTNAGVLRDDYNVGGPVPPQRGPMQAGIGQMFKKR